MSGKRNFTLDEANRALPYVRRVVTDLVHDYHEWQEALAEYELAAARRRAMEDGAQGDGGQALALEKRLSSLAAAIEAYVGEVETVGAEVKGFGEGLVDFPGERDGQSIYWCWMLGEPAVEHWHDRESGFAGRRPVTELAPAGTE
jgi:hypothetical protein